MGGAWVFPRSHPWILVNSQIYQDRWTWECFKMLRLPRGGATRRNIFISPRCFLFLSVLHSASLLEGGKSLRGLFLCNKVPLPAQKQCCLQCRHPCTMAQVFLHWSKTAHCVAAQGDDRNPPYSVKCGKSMHSPFHAVQQGVLLGCIVLKYHKSDPQLFKAEYPQD